jgi:hypothetical protein
VGEGRRRIRRHERGCVEAACQRDRPVGAARQQGDRPDQAEHHPRSVRDRVGQLLTGIAGRTGGGAGHGE